MKNTDKNIPRDKQLEFEVDFYKKLLKNDPQNIEALKAIAENYTTLGDHKKGLEIDLKLANLLPNDSTVLYNLSCSYALLNKIDLSLNTLKKALEIGYDDIALLLEDQDLENIRQDPRYAELINTHGGTL